MNDTTLTKLALMTSFIGLFVLLVTSFFIEERMTPSPLTEDSDSVYLRGYIERDNSRDKVALWSITQPNLVDVVFFPPHSLNITTGDLVEIKGRKDGDEIIADEVNILNEFS